MENKKDSLSCSYLENAKFCNKCGRELTTRKIFAYFDSKTGEKCFNTEVFCPLWDGGGIFKGLFNPHYHKIFNRHGFHFEEGDW